MNEVRKATHSGTVTIGERVLSCAVLDDSTRVLTQVAVFAAFGRPRRSRHVTDRRNEKMPSFMDAKNLKPFADQVFSGGINLEVKYKGKDNRILTGYRAEILPLVCETYLLARDAGVLISSQQAMATASEILMRSLAKVGIVALIDEATGYQDTREISALQKLLRAYVSEELMSWQKTFPDVFYQELFRLNGWDFNAQLSGKKPRIIGAWTNKLVYEQLPPGVLEDLKQRTPKSENGNRSHKFFQLLTEDIGSTHLREQINRVITVFRLSDNMEHMWSQFAKLKQRREEDIGAPFVHGDKGRTIAPSDASSPTMCLPVNTM